MCNQQHSNDYAIVKTKLIIAQKSMYWLYSCISRKCLRVCNKITRSLNKDFSKYNRNTVKLLIRNELLSKFSSQILNIKDSQPLLLISLIHVKKLNNKLLVVANVSRGT